MPARGEGPELEGDSAVQALSAALKRNTSLKRTAAGGEGRALRGGGDGRRAARCGRRGGKQAGVAGRVRVGTLVCSCARGAAG
jgi:hypothetical protein